ncbi:MAG: biotin--[acetyl-CoA-carboxylase] ligase [Candidatus Omnitrophica bacterium]|nr:biotin--[acetyl-CoA-carboxylase] ligase [Candidatus Omnitrophota bacterium]
MTNEVINLLKSCDGYVSGEEMSQKLHISRAAVWKSINELRGLGYKIEAAPRLGYRIVSSPDKLFSHELEHRLNTKVVGRKVFYEETVSSTMDKAFELAVKGEKEGTVIAAETQTKGRGRMGRVWTSPKGQGIYFSVILRPALSPSDIARLTLLAGVAVCEAIRQVAAVDAKIKWPNDVLIKGKKAVGILTELNAESDRVRFCVIGIGINVNTPLRQLPENATSLKQETGKMHSRIGLAQEVLRRLDVWYDILKMQGFPPVIERWKTLSSTLGRLVRLKDQQNELEGKAVDLDEYGGLMIQTKSGVVVKRMSGDVIEQ